MSGGTFLQPADENGPDEAERSESKRHHRTLFAFYLAAQLLGFLTAVLALHHGHDGWGLTPALIALFPLAHAGAVAREDRPAATQQLRVFLVALLTAVGASLTFWLVLEALPADVTEDVQLTDATGLGTGATAVLQVDDAPGIHDELRVTLAVKDETTGQSPCIPTSDLRFTGADLARDVTVRMRDEVSATLPLQAAGPGVSVDITVVTRSGCRLTLVREQVNYQ